MFFFFPTSMTTNHNFTGTFFNDQQTICNTWNSTVSGDPYQSEGDVALNFGAVECRAATSVKVIFVGA